MRALYSLRWHLDAHDTSDDAAKAAGAFLNGFMATFGECVALAYPEAIDGNDLSHEAAARMKPLYAAIILQTPDLIEQLDSQD